MAFEYVILHTWAINLCLRTILKEWSPLNSDSTWDYMKYRFWTCERLLWLFILNNVILWMSHCSMSNGNDWERTELLGKKSVLQSPLQAHSLHFLHKGHQTMFNPLYATLISSCLSYQKDMSNTREKWKYNFTKTPLSLKG